MKTNALYSSVLLLLGSLLPLQAGNPLINTVHSADPSGHVWPGDDRLWVYASHDQPGTNTHDTMISYHVFSTKDLVNWTDYGVVLHQNGVDWAAGNMWAIDCVKKDDRYLLVYCAVDKTTGNFHTALAESKSPQGPFKDIGKINGTEGGQDPALFVDDDGQAYLYWGGGNSCHAAKLTPDLRSVAPGSVVNLTSQLTWVYEGPWMHKYKGKYYLSYPGLLNRQWPERMYYAIGDSPLGPFTFKGEYIPLFDQHAGTNHGSILEYKGRWLALHHGSWLSKGNGVCRNLFADWLEYNPDGTIKPITPKPEGVALGTAPAPSRVTLQLEAENGPASLGSLVGCTVETTKPGYSGFGYVSSFKGAFSGVTVFAQSAQARKVRVFVRYASTAKQKTKLLVNYISYDDPKTPEPGRFDKCIEFPSSSGTWAEHDAGVVQLQAGDNTLRLYGGSGGVQIDFLRCEPVDE